MLCGSWKDFQTPPGSGFKRAILFEAGGTEPKLVWVKTGWISFAEYEVADIRSHLGGDNPTPREYPANWNAVQQKQLSYTTTINFNDDANFDGSVLNQCLPHANGGLLDYPWMGNILGMRKKGTGRDPSYYDHVDLADLRHFVD